MAGGDYATLGARQRAEVRDGLFLAVRRLRWSADRLGTEREQRLRELLAWSVERSPFHRERLAEVDVGHFTEADLPVIADHDQSRSHGQFRSSGDRSRARHSTQSTLLWKTSTRAPIS